MTDDIKAAVRRQFDPVAANYSTSAVHARGADLTALVEAAQLTGQERVLDAGCGTGHTALALAAQGAQVVAIDLTAAMLEQGRRLAAARGLTEVEFRLGDVEQLPFGGGEFDLVVSRYSAHHWPHPQRALAEFRRVLRPAGRLLLADIVSFDSFALDTFLQSIELLRDPSHVRDHTTEQWLALCASAGFAAEVLFTWEVRLDFADWLARMQTPPSHSVAIQSLFDSAPAETRAAFRLEADYSFTLNGALIGGRAPTLSEPAP
jgi:ubiquinone/menaquinone biosynthesis C-methylase UbiE